MTVESAKFTRKKEQAIANLLQKPTIAEAAQETGIAEVTLFRWLQDPDFNTAYKQARREVVSSAVGFLQYAASSAVRVLVSVMNDTDSPASSRVTAARAVIETAIKAVELQDFEERISALEELEKTSRR